MGYTIGQFTKEYKRKHVPNVRTIGGIYFTGSHYDISPRVMSDFDSWNSWNCNRCSHDFLTNKKESIERLNKNLPISYCYMQSDIILNYFEYDHRIPDTTMAMLGMNRYGIGTCALFEECDTDNTKPLTS